MIDINTLSFGQRIDPDNGLVESWFSHGALDAIKAMDLSDKIILQYGSGLGDAWLAGRCKKLCCIERDEEWLHKSGRIAAESGILNIEYIFRPCPDCAGLDEFYTAFPEGVKPDVIIVDDAYRYECIMKAVGLDYPVTLIVDNWQQDYVFICPAAEEALKKYESKYYVQPDHTDHVGKPWSTAFFYLK